MEGNSGSIPDRKTAAPFAGDYRVCDKLKCCRSQVLMYQIGTVRTKGFADESKYSFCSSWIALASDIDLKRKTEVSSERALTVISVLFWRITLLDHDFQANQIIAFGAWKLKVRKLWTWLRV